MFGFDPKIIVFDTEFTAWEGSEERNWSAAGEYMEIVQIGAVKIETQSMEELESMLVYVKPVKNPKLSEYFTKLTNIVQETVDRGGIGYAEALEKFTLWSGGLKLYSWGGDRDVLEENAKLLGIEFPFRSSQFADIREFFQAQGVLVEKYMSSTIPRAFGEEPLLRAHDALNDARSIAQALRVFRRKTSDNK